MRISHLYFNAAFCCPSDMTYSKLWLLVFVWWPGLSFVIFGSYFDDLTLKSNWWAIRSMGRRVEGQLHVISNKNHGANRYFLISIRLCQLVAIVVFQNASFTHHLRLLLLFFVFTFICVVCLRLLCSAYFGVIGMTTIGYAYALCNRKCWTLCNA